MDDSKLPSDPLILMQKWLIDVSKAAIKEPNAMALATSTVEGTPSVRMVLLRKLSVDGLFFFTNYESRKARELAQNPRASVCLHWKELDRQVRVDGTVVRCSEQDSLAYFLSRPRSSQISAWASPQSQRIADRKTLEGLAKEVEEKFVNRVELPLPHFWGGFRLIPYHFEFWQGRESRLHDRTSYRKEGNVWVQERLAP